MAEESGSEACDDSCLQAGHVLAERSRKIRWCPWAVLSVPGIVSSRPPIVTQDKLCQRPCTGNGEKVLEHGWHPMSWNPQHCMYLSVAMKLTESE